MVEEEEQDTMDKKIGQHMALDKIKSHATSLITTVNNCDSYACTSSLESDDEQNGRRILFRT